MHNGGERSGTRACPIYTYASTSDNPPSGRATGHPRRDRSWSLRSCQVRESLHGPYMITACALPNYCELGGEAHTGSTYTYLRHKAFPRFSTESNPVGNR